MKIFNLQIKLSFLIGLALIGETFLLQAKAQSAQPVPALIEVPFAPMPVKAMGKINLAYELHITNFSRASLVLTGVEVSADDAQKNHWQIIEMRNCSSGCSSLPERQTRR